MSMHCFAGGTYVEEKWQRSALPPAPSRSHSGQALILFKERKGRGADITSIDAAPPALFLRTTLPVAHSERTRQVAQWYFYNPHMQEPTGFSSLYFQKQDSPSPYVLAYSRTYL